MDADSHLAACRERMKAMSEMAEVSMLQTALASNIKNSMDRIERIMEQPSANLGPGQEDAEVAAWRRKIDELSRPTPAPTEPPSRCTTGVFPPPQQLQLQQPHQQHLQRQQQQQQHPHHQTKQQQRQFRAPGTTECHRTSMLDPALGHAAETSSLQTRALCDVDDSIAVRVPLWRRCMCCWLGAGYQAASIEEPTDAVIRPAKLKKAK